MCIRWYVYMTCISENEICGLIWILIWINQPWKEKIRDEVEKFKEWAFWWYEEIIKCFSYDKRYGVMILKSPNLQWMCGNVCG